jgi:hypothetical protein
MGTALLGLLERLVDYCGGLKGWTETGINILELILCDIFKPMKCWSCRKYYLDLPCRVELILWIVQWRQANYQALDLAPVRVTTKNKAYQILSPFHYSSILSGLSGRRFIHWNRLNILWENL